MFERFTERSRQVVVRAQDAARSQHVGYIGCEHILLGLLAEEDGVAAKVLVDLGVTYEKATEGVDRRITGRVREDKELQGSIPFTPRTKEVLESALREALSLGHNYIGTEHILLSLVHKENVAVEILRDDFSLTPEQIRNEVIRALSGPNAPILQKLVTVTKDRLPESRVGTPENEEDLRNLIDMAIHLGRQYPDVPSSRIIKAVLMLHKREET